MLNSIILAIFIKFCFFYKLNILAEFYTNQWIPKVIVYIGNIVSLIRAIIILSFNYISLVKPISIF